MTVSRVTSTLVVLDAKQNVSLALHLLPDPLLLRNLLFLSSPRFFFHFSIQSFESRQFCSSLASICVVGWWVEGRDVTGLW